MSEFGTRNIKDEPIGAVTAHGESTLNIKQRYECLSVDRPSIFSGFVIESSEMVKLEGGEMFNLRIFVPRSMVDRLCGFLQSELHAQERMEMRHRDER